MKNERYHRLDPIIREVLPEIDRYLKATGYTQGTFSRMATGNTTTVEKMKAGRPIWTHTVTRIRRYMRDNPPPDERAQA